MEVLIKSSSECFQGWSADKVGGGGGGGRSFHSLAKNECSLAKNECEYQSLSTRWRIKF